MNAIVNTNRPESITPMPVLELQSSQHVEFIDLTPQLQALVPPELADGICTATSQHTTAGLTINENADPDVVHDLIGWLDRSIPWGHTTYRHGEGNSAAHIKASLVGLSQIVPVRHGRLCLGTWQSVYFCEFDGPRRRRVEVRFCPSFALDEKPKTIHQRP
jgi:secondary thiamine-phosphate synthase enzyme